MKIGWIVFAVIILANVIGPILKKREEKARKKRQQGSTQPGHPAQHSSAPGPPSVSTGSSRMEQLLARRQAQLEELQERGERARLRVKWGRKRQGKPRPFHVQVRRGDGSIEDPSARLGMGRS